MEQFYPDRMASRILGMGDVLTLIEKAEAQIDEEKAKQMTQKLKKAQFDFDDLSGKHEADAKYGRPGEHHEHDAGAWGHGRQKGKKSG